MTVAPPPAPCVVAVVTMSFGQSSEQLPPAVLLVIVSEAVQVLSFGNCSSVVLLTVTVLSIVAPTLPFTL